MEVLLDTPQPDRSTPETLGHCCTAAYPIPNSALPATETGLFDSGRRPA